ncbi:CHAT domain-containing protein [Chryseobacterium flavum]|uniref:CHAT domain-containing protein n=1 Tax=Chryseobacterium flavum TaxID=415851 RepID=UPI002FDB2DBE
MTGNINTLIEYIVISDGSPMESPILPPTIFNLGIINFIKRLPKDILQLVDTIDYYEFHLRSSINFGYDFKVFNIKDFDFLKDAVINPTRVQLIFFNGESELHIQRINELLDEKSEIRFYFSYKNSGKIKSDNLVNSSVEFLQKIIEKQEYIKKSLNLDLNNLTNCIPIDYKKLVDFSYFIPSQNNFYTMNCLIDNFCYSNSETEEEILTKHEKISSQAVQKKDTFERQEVFSKQLDNLDYFRKISISEGIIKNVTNIESPFSPLIFVAPFHNPDLDIKEKSVKYALTLEQTSNYTIDTNTGKADPLTSLQAMRVHKLRLNYLDDISYLHASFDFSPTLRLPIKGKSIYRELSFFGPKSAHSHFNAKTRKKLKKSITNFGKNYIGLTISKKIQNIIKKRNSQIVVISDLPFEWIDIEGIPLSFTHDVCRLPETSLHGLMSLYLSAQNFRFSIGSDFLQKTLVILGEHSKAFSKWHTNVYDLQKLYNFNVAECSNNNDVKKAVAKFNPELLIFDCHGGFDSKTNSTYLQIGKDILDSKYIVENEIFAPIVFLSACGTAPTYGTMNPIANAFFEAGALSVTSTFLPIAVDSGSILYLRLLSKLEYALKKTIHKNWLEFISHIIRTSTINEAYLDALFDNITIEKSDYTKSHLESLMDSLQFHKRRKLYRELDEKISKMSQKDKEYYSSQIPEYLLYTNLGRSDLIFFENWRSENIDSNLNIK